MDAGVLHPISRWVKKPTVHSGVLCLTRGATRGGGVQGQLLAWRNKIRSKITNDPTGNSQIIIFNKWLYKKKLTNFDDELKFVRIFFINYTVKC